MAGLNESTGMDLGLNGRVAIVAAASKGLGRAVAEELAREGTHVAICARTPDTVAETAAHIQKATSRDVFHQALDVTDSVAVASFVAAVEGLLLSNSVRAAVTGLARTLANEYAADGITVNNVCPGYTRTARLDGLASTISARTGSKPEEVFASWEREIPARRLGTPQEFAAVVAFLASERASYVTGASIAVDGGLVRSLL